MVALVISVLISLLMAAGIGRYATRRATDAVPSWGEAMLGASYVFFLMFLIFGVVPHQWLTLAENELSFRADKIFTGRGLVTPISQGGWFPFDITFRVISDSVAATIYIVFLVLMMKQFKSWQERNQAAPAEIATSTYGRPLVKRG